MALSILAKTGNLIHIMEHRTRAAQCDTFDKVLEAYEMCDSVKGLCFDTTASNTGRHSGTNVRFN